MITTLTPPTVDANAPALWALPMAGGTSSASVISRQEYSTYRGRSADRNIRDASAPRETTDDSDKAGGEEENPDSEAREYRTVDTQDVAGHGRTTSQAKDPYETSSTGNADDNSTITPHTTPRTPGNARDRPDLDDWYHNKAAHGAESNFNTSSQTIATALMMMRSRINSLSRDLDFITAAVLRPTPTHESVTPYRGATVHNIATPTWSTRGELLLDIGNDAAATTDVHQHQGLTSRAASDLDKDTCFQATWSDHLDEQFTRSASLEEHAMTETTKSTRNARVAPHLLEDLADERIVGSVVSSSSVGGTPVSASFGLAGGVQPPSTSQCSWTPRSTPHSGTRIHVHRAPCDGKPPIRGRGNSMALVIASEK